MPQLGTFNWVGGKYKKLNWLIPLIEPPGITSFVDAFGGSAVVLLNRKKTRHEVYNDLDRNAVNFFRVLRDQPEELFRLLELTPYSKEEFVISKLPVAEDHPFGDLEAARRFFCSISMSYSGTRSTFGHGTTSTGNGPMPARLHIGRIDRLMNTNIVSRLREVEMWNRPAIEVIEKFKEKPTALIYLDPPYEPSTWVETSSKYHTPPMTKEDHKAMLEAIADANCRVAISGYDNEVYNKVLEGWRTSTKEVQVTVGGKHENARRTETEVLWMNYDQNGWLYAENDVLGINAELL